MIPGKQYKPEDFLKIAWRYRWIICVPLVVAATATFLYSRTLPNRYRSSATVLIIPPQLPANYVRPTVVQNVRDRIEHLRRQILSRARLEGIIDELKLYETERKTLLMDQVIELMRNDADVQLGRTGRREVPNNFVVSFDSEDPESAMLVAERLASLFVRENIEGRNIQTEGAIQFLQSQLDESLRQLQEHEGRLEALKKANAGRMPGQVETNLQLMQSARQEIQAMADGINRDRERQLTLERTIAEETTYGADTVISKGARDGQAGQAAGSAAQQLAAARGSLDALRLRLKEDHPDVQIARNRIAELEKRADAEALQQPVSNASSMVGLTPAEAERQKRISRLRAEMERIDREILAKQAAALRAQNRITEHERRILLAPGLEAEMDDIMRNYGSLRTKYDGLLMKLQDAKLASDAEQRQVGQQFRIIDQARRPQRPYSPDRGRMNLLGAVAGLGFGLAIAGLLAYRDTSLRSHEDVLAALSLPVVALVPFMRTADEVRRQRRRRIFLLGSSAAAMLVVSLAAVAWKLRLFEQWGR